MVRSASSRSFCPFQRRTLMHGDVVGLVALDFILWLILACVVRVPFVINIFGVHLDDRPGDVSSLRVPGHVIADLECSLHDESPQTAPRPPPPPAPPTPSPPDAAARSQCIMG